MQRLNFVLRRFFIFFIILAILCITFDICMSSITTRASLYHAKLLAYNSINDAIIETMSKSQIDYNDLVTLNYDDDNNVRSIETNSEYINRIKATLVNGVNCYLSEYAITTIEIPIGTFTGNDYLSGMGPKVDVEVQFGGCAVTDMISEFKSAGINQTCHRILVKVSVNIYVYEFGKHLTDTVECECCIAETVIVGTVPEAYVDFNKNN